VIRVTESDQVDAPYRDDGASRSRTSGELGRLARSRSLPDPLYGTVRVAAWAAALLTTPPLRRLVGVSLSDVPGELLFAHAFPSRLDHTLGVYHLARLARPRDRALQAAALFHDLGHGPFSHLTEPLMRERLGEDHESRSVRLVAQVRASLPAGTARLLTWLDWGAVTALMQGAGMDGRGALLNGQLDYDNCDNVARFLLASGLGIPSYDPVALARGLRPLAADLADGGNVPGGVLLLPAVEAQAQAWRADRAVVYGFLHAGHQNLAAHSMLRKAVDLAAAANILPAHFFDLSDAEALALFARALDRGLAGLVGRVRAGQHELYRCVWEAELPAEASVLPNGWQARLALEARLAAEAALAPHEVIAEALVSKAERSLPPVARAGRSRPLTLTAPAPSALCILHLFAAPDAGRDYVHRLCLAAERHFAPLGARVRPAGGD
jgi:uncharacterized protein